MKRALFVISRNGNGHKVRCGALADELRGRGWECDLLPFDEAGEADVLVIDDPEARVSPGNSKVVQIVDVPGRSNADVLVCGSAGVTPDMFSDCGAKRVLAGPEYALLRPEFKAAHERAGRVFAHLSWPEPETLDIRALAGVSAEKVASMLWDAVVHQDKVITYGGMRAMEAMCVAAGFRLNMEIQPRNSGEQLNAEGFRAGVSIDGLGCQRVADAIEDMVR